MSNTTRETKPSRAPDQRGVRARAAIIAAATDLFSERGYAGVSIADVATLAKVAKPSVLYHFADKETLWRESIDQIWHAVNAFYAERMPVPGPNPVETIAAMLRLFVEAARRWPAYVRIPFIEGTTASWRSDYVIERYWRAHVNSTEMVLRKAARMGLLRVDDTSHAQVVLTSGINVLMTQTAMFSAGFERPVDAPGYIDRYVDTIVDLTFRSKTLDMST